MPAPLINPASIHPPTPPSSSQQQQGEQLLPPRLNILLSQSLPQLPATARPANTESAPRPSSPVAPEYSPITPKVRPALPATIDLPAAARDDAAQSVGVAPEQQKEQKPLLQQSEPPPQPQQQPARDSAPVMAVPPPPPPPPAANFIPQPPPQPFSSADSTDAIALRAAISSLQFQKKKAQEDLRALEKLRGRAVDDPETFRRELQAGRVREQKVSFADWMAVLEAEGSDDEDEDEGEGRDKETGNDSANEDLKDTEGNVEMRDRDREPEASSAFPPTQPASTTSNPTRNPSSSTAEPSFDRLPAPQNVVRMPYVNWDKYHIVGSGLERLHAVQQRWPGAAFAYDETAGRGREHAVVAPYSPWLDQVEGAGGDSGGGGGGGSMSAPSASAKRTDSVATPATSVSEHPMETRRGSRMH